MELMTQDTRDLLESFFDSRAAMAEFVGKTAPMATYWLNGTKVMTASIAKKLADYTGIDFFDLRPDLR
jgi:hypothetical protein